MMKRLALIAVLFFVWHAVAAQKISANLNTAFQINLVTFVLPEGRILVYLPGDISPGDQISGNIIVIPKGILQTGKIRFETTILAVRSGPFRLKVPDADSLTVALETGSGQSIAALKIPVQGGAEVLASIQLPTIGQAGRPLVIPGKFDGDFMTTSVKINQQSIPLIAESPREVAAYPPNGLLGLTEIAVEKNGVSVTGDYRSIGVSFSTPKMMLYKGEKAKVKMWVKGLKGIVRPVAIDVTNLTPDIVAVTPPTVIIQPKMVAASGNVLIPIVLERLKSGTFNLAANVNAEKSEAPTESKQKAENPADQSKSP